MRTKIYILIVLALAIFISLSGCTDTDAARMEEQQVTSQNQAKLIDNQPIPSFDWSLERDVFIQIYNLRNEAASTYTVVTTNFGQQVYACPSIGYPIPADSQLTNPLAPVSSFNTESAVVEQPEPNGLYSSKNTVGTWVLCVLDTGEIYPYYTENNANTWPFPVVRAADGAYVPVQGAKPVKTITINKP